MKPILSIIIVNWNTKNLLKQCLDSILKNDKRLDFSQKIPKSEEVIPSEIIIVDNGSTDGSKEYLENLKLKAKSLKVIFNDQNLGFAKANNQGIKITQGEYVLLLNSDTIVSEGAISQTLFWLSAHPKVAVAGCKLLNQNGSDQSSYGHFPDLKTVFLMLFKEHFGGAKTVRRSGDKITETEWVMGAFLMARKYLFVKVGLLDENIFMYMEEIEWCYRVKKGGHKIFFYPNAKITHLGSGSSKNGRKDPILNIYKGLIYFYQKHKSLDKLLLLKIMLKIKAGIGYFVGIVTNNHYLKQTYGQAFKLV